MRKFIADVILKIIGWQVKISLPREKKYVLIGAFHTTNWDMPLAILTFWSSQKKIKWLAKKQIFVFPFGYFFRALGGIAIDRSAPKGYINQIAGQFDEKEEMILCLSPEGTRSRTERWKTGFYYIALTANVPICLGYIDYPSRTVGFKETIIPSGDIKQDFEKIKQFYQDKTGKYPEKQGPVRLKDSE